MTRMRGNWPEDHPATCLFWQGANASPLTGSMRGIWMWYFKKAFPVWRCLFFF